MAKKYPIKIDKKDPYLDIGALGSLRPVPKRLYISLRRAGDKPQIAFNKVIGCMKDKKSKMCKLK